MLYPSVIASVIGVFVGGIEVTLIMQVTVVLSSFILITNFLKINYPSSGGIAIIKINI